MTQLHPQAPGHVLR